MTDKQLIARFLELQEHPEQVTDEQLRQMLNDEQMHELVEQMAFTKRAFKNEESQADGLSVADEWEKFAASHAEELTNAAKISIFKYQLRKIAASFIGILLASDIALAAIHIVRQYQKPETPQATDTIAATSPQCSTLNAQLEETRGKMCESRLNPGLRTIESPAKN